MKKSKGIAIFIACIGVLAALVFYAYVILSPSGLGKDQNIKLGLDLAGGVSITYEAVGDTPSDSDMADTVFKLQQRVESYSTEATVYREGDKRITVEIPGVTDANQILKELGNPGTLEFQTSDGTTFMTGDQVADAQAAVITNESGAKENVVELKLTDEGAKTFGEVTAENIGKQLPIVFDGEIISNPNVNEAITGGSAQISGMESNEEAERLATQIRVGSLSVELKELRSEVVSAQLGSEAITYSLKAAAVGLILVMIFMMIMYAVPGVAASLALTIYVGLVVATIYLFEITLTLPGIAGIILSIGMAVDANVIIFARIREEIAAGRNVGAAIDAGFSKALSAILDGNVTTLIAAAVLGVLGSGTVKGFAYTLAIGTLLSMFTALVITKFLLRSLYAMGVKSEKLYGKTKNTKIIDFVSKRKVFFIISAIAILAGFVGMGVNAGNGNRALNYSLDFVGGTSTTVNFDKDYDMETVNKDMVPLVRDAAKIDEVQPTKVQGSKQVNFKTTTLTLKQRTAINKALEKAYGVKEKDIESESISSTISSEMRRDALVAVVIAIVLMLIYIRIRFKDLRFATGAVLALAHDVLVVLTCYALLRISVGNTFIACMLTIIGYSINDTIVIFDRIRENIKNKKAKTPEELKEVANRSLSQTFSRSVNTSITTFIMVFCLFLFGGVSIREFALPLMVGLVSGAYSSICIAVQLWYEFKVHGKDMKANTKQIEKKKA
ncbi:MAG: protein translocase subunit SecD [Lachnospiraceae bacterium]